MNRAYLNFIRNKPTSDTHASCKISMYTLPLARFKTTDHVQSSYLAQWPL